VSTVGGLNQPMIGEVVTKEGEKLAERAQERLARYDLGRWDELKPNVRKLLVAIEAIVSCASANRNQCLEVYKQNKVNTKNVAETLDISRTTLYNNKTALAYIEKVVEELDLEGDTFSTEDKVREQLAELKAVLDKTLIDRIERDNAILQAKKMEEENQSLINDNAELNQERIFLLKRVSELEKRNSVLEARLSMKRPYQAQRTGKMD
jgi:hypothetical protein